MGNPVEVLAQGQVILEEVLAPHGFQFRFEGSGRGSGGRFARGSFVRGDRRLELHVRSALGLVTYHVGSASVAHGDLMECVAGLENDAQYPGLSEDPLDGFRHLKADLERYGGDFLSGSGREVEACAKAAQQKATGLRRIAEVETAMKRGPRDG